MNITDKDHMEMSKLVTTCTANMEWIKERLEKGDTSFAAFDARLISLEKEHSLMKGKLGAFILGLTFFVTLVINGILWGASHLSGGK
jgi:pyruvate/2-oxoacid:ferredoxin oxidoreductase alpha subunit